MVLSAWFSTFCSYNYSLIERNWIQYTKLNSNEFIIALGYQPGMPPVVEGIRRHGIGIAG